MNKDTTNDELNVRADARQLAEAKAAEKATTRADEIAKESQAKENSGR